MFINWETFRALGVSQKDYYNTIIKRIIYSECSKEKIEECIDLLDIVKDPYELSYDMFEEFIFKIKTNDNKRISIELLWQKVNDLELKLNNTNDSHMQFDLKELLNDYVECITDIYFSLSNIELGIKYFHKNYIQSDKEIKEYVLLNKLGNEFKSKKKLMTIH